MLDEQLIEPQKIIDQIRALINRQGVVEDLVAKSDNRDKQSLVESVSRRQYQGEVYKLINRLHPSDIATLLEQLPPIQRQLVWSLIDIRSIGAVLLELSDTLRDTLVSHIQLDELVSAATHLDSDEIADLMHDLPDDVSSNLLSALPEKTREHVTSTMRFPEDTVGAWMEFDFIVVQQDMLLDDVVQSLRSKGTLPDESGSLLVVDQQGNYTGLLSVNDLLLKKGDIQVCEVMTTDTPVFHTTDSAEESARDFERYELIVAPVLNVHHKLVGVLRVNPLMDLMDELNRRTFMAQAGITKEESLFDPFMQSARNRWPWIGLNLMIIFIASYIISQFEATIGSMVALAALLPITANIGGNTGNQVVALVIRGLALNQLDKSNLGRLFFKEMSVAVINGLVWGVITAVVTLIMYQEWRLAIVIMLAMLVTIVMSALIGVCIPLLLKRLDQDPALGSSVITTGFTDTFGFLIFLGLATLLIR